MRPAKIFAQSDQSLLSAFWMASQMDSDDSGQTALMLSSTFLTLRFIYSLGLQYCTCRFFFFWSEHWNKSIIHNAPHSFLHHRRALNVARASKTTAQKRCFACCDWSLTFLFETANCSVVLAQVCLGSNKYKRNVFCKLSNFWYPFLDNIPEGIWLHNGKTYHKDVRSGKCMSPGSWWKTLKQS